MDKLKAFFTSPRNAPVRFAFIIFGIFMSGVMLFWGWFEQYIKPAGVFTWVSFLAMCGFIGGNIWLDFVSNSLEYIKRLILSVLKYVNEIRLNLAKLLDALEILIEEIKDLIEELRMERDRRV